MSAPEDKLKEQEDRHRAPLLGMRAVVIFALVLLVLLAVFVFSRGDSPGEDTGATEPTIPDAAVEQSE